MTATPFSSKRSARQAMPTPTPAKEFVELASLIKRNTGVIHLPDRLAFMGKIINIFTDNDERVIVECERNMLHRTERKISPQAFAAATTYEKSGKTRYTVTFCKANQEPGDFELPDNKWRPRLRR